MSTLGDSPSRRCRVFLAGAGGRGAAEPKPIPWEIAITPGTLDTGADQHGAAAHDVAERRGHELDGTAGRHLHAAVRRAVGRRAVDGAADDHERHRLVRERRGSAGGDAPARRIAGGRLVQGRGSRHRGLRHADGHLARRRQDVVEAVLAAPRRHQEPARLRIAVRMAGGAGRRPGPGVAGRAGRRRYEPAQRAVRRRLEADRRGAGQRARVRVLPHQRRHRLGRTRGGIPRPQRARKCATSTWCGATATRGPSRCRCSPSTGRWTAAP